MIFNLWRKYPKRKPKESGYYLCTLTEISSPSMMMLYYKVREDKWIDISRQTVFDGYNVFKVCRAPIEENHVYFDGLCERGDEVIAWKKLPKEYRRKKK